MPVLGPPPRRDGPMFVYGLLKPDELAFSVIEQFVSSTSESTVRGTLWLRDGLPLLDPGGNSQVAGWLVWFDLHRLGDAWRAVSSFEPATQYLWATVTAASGQGKDVIANVLRGQQIGVGTAKDTVQEWSARLDPVLTEGLAEVGRIVEDAAPKGVPSQPDTPDLWRTFFRLQAAYLLLWSVVERYTALRYGPSMRPTKRVKQLDWDKRFRQAVAAAGAKPGEVVDSRDPQKTYPLAADGSGAAEYYYAVRSNLSHRGKGAFKDAQLVHKAVTELSSAMKILLELEVQSSQVRPVG